jgi:hypothetical protein
MTDMGHLNEEDLVLHFYGELDSAGVTRTEAHLAGCGDCRASYTRLQRVMAAVDTLPDPVLPEGFERVTWARLQPSLRRSTGWRTWFVLSPASLALASAVLILVTGAFFAGRLSRAPEPTAVVSADQFRERVLLTDLGEHLDRSQMMLVDLVSAGEGDAVDMAAERRRAEDLVVANRLYRQTAEESGETPVSELLDELERLLVDLAASPDTMSPADMEKVRTRIDANGLLFKVRVLSATLRERQKQMRARAGQSS